MITSSAGELRRKYAESVTRWLSFGERYFERPAGAPDTGRFGPPDCGDLGIEATAQYAFVTGLAATDEAFDLQRRAPSADECLNRALGATRYCLRTHRSDPRGIDGEPRWGGTGMSPKMADQLALATAVLDGAVPEEDRAALVRVLVYEADRNTLLPYHLEHVDHGYYRKRPPVPTGRFGTSYPESNAWRACALARALLASPEHPHTAQWRESMLAHLANCLSVPADAAVDTIYAGRPLHEWHAGANLHPGFTLEHHGFFHPGYVNRTLLSLASAYYVFEARGEEPPELLLRHVPEVWDVQRRMLLSDGRLAYPAGNDYPRYAWGTLYMLPVLAFIDDLYGDALARRAEESLSALVIREQRLNGDGGYCCARLEAWREAIESDAAVAPRTPPPPVFYRSQVDAPYYLSLAHRWHSRGDDSDGPRESCDLSPIDRPVIEPECGLVAQRSPRRFASWSWQAHRCQAQGLVVPAGGDHLAEWEGNLVSNFYVRGEARDRHVLGHDEWAFDGGFATCGHLGVCGDTVEQHIAFTALPDDRTCVCISHARATREIDLLAHEGLPLNVANDVFNGNLRHIHHARGLREQQGVGAQRESIHLETAWVNVDDLLGVASLDGLERFDLLAVGTRRAPGMSLCYQELCHGFTRQPRCLSQGATIEDAAIALLADCTAAETARWPAWNVAPGLANRHLRAVLVRGADDTWYLVAAGFTHHPSEAMLPLTMEASGGIMLVGEPEQFQLVGPGAVVRLPAHGMIVIAFAAL